ncbi:MAG TPA: pyruvate kinase [Actinomycetota bacterium]|nr:pyruvate kinase [Actinomycetota bacterium]
MTDAPRRTKIVATLGPSTARPGVLDDVVRAGVDVVRVNFAHGDAAQHERAVACARAAATRAGRAVGVLVDLPGPKMRTGPIAGGETQLAAGAAFTLVARAVEGGSERASTTVDGLDEIVSPGDEIFLADGDIVLRVTSCAGGDVHTEVVRGGTLRSRKGMHVPAAEREVRGFTDDDARDLARAVELGADLVGLSFVRDVRDVRRALAALPHDPGRPLVVAKIETRAALEDLDAIVDAADAVMVARGDLGIHMPLARVPLLQKEIIRCCNRAGVPVVTATQMLESMTRAPRPTRAEATDVANAVVDGTDAVMLSEETAVGDRPADAVATMAEIARTAESWPSDHSTPATDRLDDDRVSWAVAHAAVEAAEDLRVAAILCPTRTGATARRVAAFRPAVPVVGLCERADVAAALALSWGVTPLVVPDAAAARDPSEESARAIAAARAAGAVPAGALVAVVAGTPGATRAGSTDYVRIARDDGVATGAVNPGAG